jgi:hypothetical protein
MTNDEWEVQSTIKHGPVMNDRGDRLFMTNMRGFTVRAVQDHVEDFADRYDAFVKASQKIFAADAVFQSFPDSERVREDSSSRGDSRGSRLRDRDGELCEPHRLPMRYKSGKSKAGNNYELLECTAKNNPCDAIWPDRD